VEVGGMDKAETGHDFLRLFRGPGDLSSVPTPPSLTWLWSTRTRLHWGLCPCGRSKFTFQEDH
jgi:hypothetical protein